MIFGIGFNIVKVSKISNSIHKLGVNYLKKRFTAREMQYCKTTSSEVQSYAARIAAKKAAMKALPIPLNAKNHWLDFEVVNELSGLPTLFIHGNVAQLIKEYKISKIWVSLAHISKYAIAQVIFER